MAFILLTLDHCLLNYSDNQAFTCFATLPRTTPLDFFCKWKHYSSLDHVKNMLSNFPLMHERFGDVR